MQSSAFRKAARRFRSTRELNSFAFKSFAKKNEIVSRRKDLMILGDIIKCDRKGFYKILGATAITSVFNLLFATAMKELRSLMPEESRDPLSKIRQSFTSKESDNATNVSKQHSDAVTTDNSEATKANADAQMSTKSEQSISTNGTLDTEKQKQDEEREKVISFLLKWGFIFTLSGIVTFYRRYVLGDYVNRVAVFLRYRLYNVLLSKNYSYFIKNNINSGQFVQKISNDITSITWNLGEWSAALVRGVFLSIGGITLSVMSNPELAIVSVGVMSTFALATRGLSNKMRKSKVEEIESLTRLSVLASERLSNMKFIKVNNTEEAERHVFLLKLQNFYENSQRVTKYTAYNYGVMDGFGQISLFAIVFYGFYLSPVGIMGPEMISFLIYGLFTGAGLRSVFTAMTELEKTASIYRSIYEITKGEDSPLIDVNQKAEEVLKEAYNKQRAILSEKLQDPPMITFENITFSFENEKALLHGFNMEIKPGEIIALVGPSGSGKTTILNLISKLLEPQQGKVLINNSDISNRSEIWVRSNVSYVTQEPVLFQGTIEENLKYGNEGFDLSSENLDRVCELANANEFIKAFPNGYKTEVGERGMNLSGGQRQKIALARALIKDPKILILDESTSSLDHVSEIAIIKALQNVCKDRTCIIVTHRIENFKDLITRYVNIKE